MKVVLRQTFPLGRFHATPWRVNPFDDPYGEWPPSPYRLLRGIVARFHQLVRETERPMEAIDDVIAAFADSRIELSLPPSATRAPALRQYLPGTVLEWEPAGKKDQANGAQRVAKRFLAQDNSFAVPPGEPLFWILEGEKWTAESLSTLESCLRRMTYFGRAESLTEIQVDEEPPPNLEPNCRFLEERARNAVPILCVTPSITREQLEGSATEQLKGAPTPPGTVWRYAIRPARPRMESRRVARVEKRTDIRLVQFAMGGTVSPPMSAVTTMTNWFRGRVLNCAVADRSEGEFKTWGKAPPELREQLSLLSGKTPSGEPLQGHSHFRVLVWFEEDRPTRLLAHRETPFEDWELQAIYQAAGRPLGWNPVLDAGQRFLSRSGPKARRSAGEVEEGWTVHLVPLDKGVPPPPGFDGQPARVWRSVTAYVPPWHFLDSRGYPKKGASIAEQVAKELALRGREAPESVEIDEEGAMDWVRVHVPRSRAPSKSNNSRRGFRLRLTFGAPVEGPMFLGHSAFFGLGLFRPAPDAG